MRWYLSSNGQAVGPLEAKDVLRMAKSGELKPGTFIRSEAERSWITIEQSHFAPALKQKTTVPPAAPVRVRNPPPPPRNPPPPAPPPPTRNVRWFMSRNGETVGPIDEAQIVEWVKSGIVDGQVMPEQGGQWAHVMASPFAQFAPRLKSGGEEPALGFWTRWTMVMLFCSGLLYATYAWTCNSIENHSQCRDASYEAKTAASQGNRDKALEARDRATKVCSSEQMMEVYRSLNERGIW